MLMIVLALLAGAGIGGGALFAFARAKGISVAAPAQTRPEPPVARSLTIIHLETFVLNLADDQHTYLRIGVDLGTQAAPSAKASEDNKALSPEPRDAAIIRDSILGVLTTARSSDLATAEGKARLKDQLRDVLNKRMPELGVREIYFTEFLMQQ